MERFRAAEENVASLKQEKDHNQKLKYELRRLKEEDLARERERQKRIEGKKKKKILKKEQLQQNQLLLFRESEQEIKKKRLNEQIQARIN